MSQKRSDIEIVERHGRAYFDNFDMRGNRGGNRFRTDQRENYSKSSDNMHRSVVGDHVTIRNANTNFMEGRHVNKEDNFRDFGGLGSAIDDLGDQFVSRREPRGQRNLEVFDRLGGVVNRGEDATLKDRLVVLKENYEDPSFPQWQESAQIEKVPYTDPFDEKKWPRDFEEMETQDERKLGFDERRQILFPGRELNREMKANEGSFDRDSNRGTIFWSGSRTPHESGGSANDPFTRKSAAYDRFSERYNPDQPTDVNDDFEMRSRCDVFPRTLKTGEREGQLHNRFLERDLREGVNEGSTAFFERGDHHAGFLRSMEEERRRAIPLRFSERDDRFVKRDDRFLESDNLLIKWENTLSEREGSYPKGEDLFRERDNRFAKRADRFSERDDPLPYEVNKEFQFRPRSRVQENIDTFGQCPEKDLAQRDLVGYQSRQGFSHNSSQWFSGGNNAPGPSNDERWHNSWPTRNDYSPTRADCFHRTDAQGREYGINDDYQIDSRSSYPRGILEINMAPKQMHPNIFDEDEIGLQREQDRIPNEKSGGKSFWQRASNWSQRRDSEEWHQKSGSPSRPYYESKEWSNRTFNESHDPYNTRAKYYQECERNIGQYFDSFENENSRYGRPRDFSCESLNSRVVNRFDLPYYSSRDVNYPENYGDIDMAVFDKIDEINEEIKSFVNPAPEKKQLPPLDKKRQDMIARRKKEKAAKKLKKAHRKIVEKEKKKNSVVLKVCDKSRPGPEHRIPSEKLFVFRHSLRAAVNAGQFTKRPTIFAKWRGGYILVTCIPRESSEWFQGNLKKLPNLWPDADLEIVDNVTRLKNMSAFIPAGDVTPVNTVLEKIKEQNKPRLDTKFWRVLRTKEVRGGCVLFVGVDTISVEELAKTDFEANYGKGEIKFKFVRQFN